MYILWYPFYGYSLIIQWNLSWGTTALRDHLSWKTTIFWQIDIQFNITEPVSRNHLSWDTICLKWKEWSFMIVFTVYICVRCCTDAVTLIFFDNFLVGVINGAEPMAYLSVTNYSFSLNFPNSLFDQVYRSDPLVSLPPNQHQQTRCHHCQMQ